MVQVAVEVTLTYLYFAFVVRDTSVVFLAVSKERKHGWVGGPEGGGKGVRETLRRDVPWTPSPILRTDSNSESHSGSLPPPRTHSFSENRTANLEPGVLHSGAHYQDPFPANVNKIDRFITAPCIGRPKF